MLEPVIIQFASREQEVFALRKLSKEWAGDFWSFDDVLRFTSKRDSRILYIPNPEDSKSWDAAVLFRLGIDQAELLYVFVSQTKRKHGLAKTLLKKAQELVADQESFNLEVRTSNHAAIQLYKATGFGEISKRSKYYANGEDALVMQWKPVKA